MTGRAKSIKYSMLIFSLVSLFAFAGNASAQYGPYCDHFYVPLQTALDAMVSDSQVTVKQVTVPGWASDPKYYYEFKPAVGSPTDAFIIYPGACLDERAYAVLAHDIAAAGYLVAIVPMPDYLAFLGNQSRANEVISNHPEIATWSIGGHSLGGVGACSYVNGSYTYNNKINGVVLWASYPSSSISTKPVKVISIWGTNDGYTTSDKIDASKPNLPADTRYVALQGANHSQFGAYGFSATDYTFVQPNPDPGDNPATITRQQQTDLIVSYTLNFLDSLTLAPSVPAALETITANDGSTWERVSAPGFGDPNNTDVVSLTPFQGNLYALTRNDETGFELWKTTVGNGWQRIAVQGFTDQNTFYGYLQNPLPAGGYGPASKYNLNMNIWGDMIEFKGYLYVAVSTGYQGSALFGSQGTMIWRTDGVQWEPVIGRGLTHDITGTITAIDSCENNDGSYTATFSDSSKNWAVNSLAGCTLTVEATYTSTTHGTTGLIVPGLRLFKIISNTNNTLTVQEDEKANNTTQYTICAEHAGGGDAGRARNFVAGCTVGAAYRIDVGSNSQGFGDMWNKSIIDLEVLNDELFASIGLNYEQGARVMRTSDGITWVADSAYSMGNIHGYDWHDGSSLTTCPDSTSSVRNTPVSSSATKMIKSNVNGQETLYIGGTGTGGCNGRGARVYRRDGVGTWTPIVDVLVDTDTIGTNENGFGYPAYNNDFFYSAFQAWSWAEYNGLVFIGIARLEGGGLIMYTPDGSDSNNSWGTSMGTTPTTYNTNTDGSKISVPPLYDPAYTGFGDVLNTASYLHTFNGALYAGTLVTNLSLYYSNPIDGADIWKGIWDVQNNKIDWTLVNSNGFGDSTVLQFQSFTDYGNTMYVAAATVNPSDFHGQEPVNYTGVKIYRLQVPVTTTTTTAPVTSTTTAPPTTTTTAAATTTTTAEPTLIELSSFEAKGVWRGIILAWETESEIDNAGFNIYRAEAEDGEYVKINALLIPAKGSTTEGASYRYVDQTAKRGKTYYYKLEDIDLSGTSTLHGPVNAAAKGGRLLKR